MHALDVLGDPIRRRILELLAEKENSSGDIVVVLRQEFGITQWAVSQHLRVLRDHGFASVRNDAHYRRSRLSVVKRALARTRPDGWGIDYSTK